MRQRSAGLGGALREGRPYPHRWHLYNKRHAQLSYSNRSANCNGLRLSHNAIT